MTDAGVAGEGGAGGGVHDEERDADEVRELFDSMQLDPVGPPAGRSQPGADVGSGVVTGGGAFLVGAAALQEEQLGARGGCAVVPDAVFRGVVLSNAAGGGASAETFRAGNDSGGGATASADAGSSRTTRGDRESMLSSSSDDTGACSREEAPQSGRSAGGHLHVHRGSSAETLVVPTNVRNFLDQYYEANTSCTSIYRQAVVASRALRSVGEETGDEPLGAPEARRSSKSARARHRASRRRRVASPSPSTPGGSRRWRKAARVSKRAERASTKRLVEILFEQCGAVTGRLARSTRVYDGKRAAARSAFCGRAMVIQDLNHSCVVWAAVVKDDHHFYCSCQGRREAEMVAAQIKRGLSSTCKHARALSEAHADLAAVFGYSGLTSLYERHPYLANTVGSGGGDEPQTEHVANLPNGGELHVVGADDQWVTVEKPPAAARNQRVFCLAPLCRSSNRVCIHAQAVSPPGDADGNSDECDGKAESHADEVAKELAARHAASPFRDVDWPRRSGSLLPCPTEVELCSELGKSAKLASTAGVDATYPDVLAEPACLVHGTGPRDLRNIQVNAAKIITVDGWVSAQTSSWQCPDCSEDNNIVRFDGTSHALFAISRETLFTRTFLDVVINITLTTKSSLAAASAVIAFQMHANSVLYGRDVGVLRQIITTATELYAKTLIVPPQIYQCTNCRRSRRRPYTHIVCDGQTVAPFKNRTHPFVRDSANCPTVPVPIAEGCVARVAGVRRVVRKRVSVKWNEECPISKADQPKMAQFMKCGADAPAIDLSRLGRAKSAEWAGSYLFFSFYNAGGSSTAVTCKKVESGSVSGGSSTGGAESGGDGEPSCSSSFGSSSAGASPALKSCHSATAAFGPEGLSTAMIRHRWGNVRTFFRTFLAEPVIGVFGGCDRRGLKRLGRSLVRGDKQFVWLGLLDCVQGINVLLPFLLQVGDDLDLDPLMSRAVGELVLFALETDVHVEKLWMLKATADSKEYQELWQNTSSGKVLAWRAKYGTADPRSGLRSHALSVTRALQQAREVASGQVWPLLDQVRPGPRDDRAAALRKKRKAGGSGKRRASKGKKVKEAKVIGDEDCRHEFKASKVFAPGVVSFLCSCGILLGFEMLEDVESPACIVAALAARFPRLPYVIYFDTACQAARNATRRLPWLVRLSGTTSALDRFHAPGHVCSPMFDANMYPHRSSGHKTSAAENRHSLNKPLKTHLTYLGQDRFIVQMRLHGAFNNLRVKYRKHLGVGKASLPEVTHRPLTPFFHAYVVNHCEVAGCDCRPALEVHPPPTPPSSAGSTSSSRSASPSPPSSLASSSSSGRSLSPGFDRSCGSSGSSRSYYSG